MKAEFQVTPSRQATLQPLQSASGRHGSSSPEPAGRVQPCGQHGPTPAKLISDILLLEFTDNKSRSLKAIVFVEISPSIQGKLSYCLLEKKKEANYDLYDMCKN